MSRIDEAFARLTERAQQLNNEHWVLTGNNIDQINAALCALQIQIELLASKILEINPEVSYETKDGE